MGGAPLTYLLEMVEGDEDAIGADVPMKGDSTKARKPENCVEQMTHILFLII